ncbi:MAG: hypothetical protein OEY03_09000 [Rhizobacter sp.]|nr:hypothetical protein [Rhizobacter sp.]
MPAAFGPADLKLLAAVQQHNTALRVVLCTLARRGAALRRDEATRARAWIDTLATHPYYKGGQFLFDMLEWEDFMLDGESPPLLDDAALAAALNRYAQMLRALSNAITQAPVGAVPPPTTAASAGPTLPPLNGSFYLYPDVVLGLISMLTREL